MVLSGIGKPIKYPPIGHSNPYNNDLRILVPFRKRGVFFTQYIPDSIQVGETEFI